uniref:Molecule interacting with CasL protein 1 n=1 Tax=Astyanax mexicanus TaxID=7994 RepID=W5K147_ASTMX
MLAKRLAVNPLTPGNPAHALFDLFVAAQTCKEVQLKFAELCRHLEVDSQDYRNFYNKLKERLNYWKAKDLWQKIDSRANHSDYEQGKPCAKTKCLVLGAGPCGLRVAIELALLGAQVVLLEKRTSFSRNNVLHLWPYTIRDLRNLGAKKFYGKFCCGSLDHISIRQLQLILLKLALLLGVEVHTGVSFKGLVEPQASGAAGWKALLHPESHPAAAYQFDVFISAGGGRFVPDGFKRKELRGKLAIGITANFVNRHTAAEAQVPEISGVARIYNQKFFQELHTEKGIDLENIVYYKDDTHYFVMTAKKNSLLKKGVIKQDFSDADQLLAPANVNQEALLQYARDAAQFSTGGKLPDMEFALNHAGQQDVAMFDFTCMHRAENASLVRERRGKKLLIGLVGDCLVEPFWPLGTGIARGFLAAFDTAWMVRNWGKGMPHLQVLSERESVYQLLSQTTPENTSKNYNAYSIDPSTRYPNVNVSSIKPKQVGAETWEEKKKVYLSIYSLTRLSDLLSWCQKHTAWCNRVQVKDLSQSWKSGLALCALIHHFRPKLIDMSRLKEKDAKFNNQLAFDILQREFGIEPIMSASDMATSKEIDQLSMVLYLTQVHNAFTETPVHKSLSLSRTRSAVFFLNKLKHNSLQRRKVGPVSELPPAEPGSSECYFCHQQLYVLERGSAEGKFFHRSCFTCQQCGTTLRQGGYTFYPDTASTVCLSGVSTGRFYCEQHSEPPNKNEQHGDDHKKGKEEEHSEESRANESPQSFRSVKRKSSYKISIDPHCDESTESDILEKQEEEDQLANRAAKDSDKPGIPTDLSTELPCPGAVPAPVPSPRKSRTPSAHSPVPKPRTIHNVVPSPNHMPTTVETIASDPRPKLSLKKLQLTDEEKTQLVNLSFSQDSDSETPASSSAASTSSSNKPNDGGEEEGYWSGGASSLSHVREKKNRRCFRRKGEPQKPAQIQQGRLRSKFSPWNLSSPRLQQRFSVLRPAGRRNDEEEEEEEEEDNEEALMTADHYLDGQQEMTKLRTLERRAKMSELQRFHKAQSIQRRLEEIEVTFKELEEKGVVLERSLRGEPGSDGSATMIDDWIELVQQKNDLVSEESDLMVASRQLELEDKQSMLELELRRFMEIDDSEKTEAQQKEEEQILQQMLEVVDMRNSLVAFLEEKRLKELNEETMGSSLLETKRHSTASAQVHWA